MRKCWRTTPEDRPSFYNIVVDLRWLERRIFAPPDIPHSPGNFRSISETHLVGRPTREMLNLQKMAQKTASAANLPLNSARSSPLIAGEHEVQPMTPQDCHKRRFSDITSLIAANRQGIPSVTMSLPASTLGRIAGGRCTTFTKPGRKGSSSLNANNPKEIGYEGMPNTASLNTLQTPQKDNTIDDEYLEPRKCDQCHIGSVS